MAQQIEIKHSATSGSIPTTSSLHLGQLAINSWDGKLYFKKNNGTESIIELGTGGASVSASYATNAANAVSASYAANTKGATVTVSTTAPSNPKINDIWIII